ncbi:hypothetical protein [Nonomuraea sp. NPDC003201]
MIRLLSRLQWIIGAGAVLIALLIVASNLRGPALWVAITAGIAAIPVIIPFFRPEGGMSAARTKLVESFPQQPASLPTVTLGEATTRLATGSEHSRRSALATQARVRGQGGPVARWTEEWLALTALPWP